MIEIDLETIRWAPRSGHQVTLRTSTNGWVDLPGVYTRGGWTFAVLAAPLEFPFVLDAGRWEVGPNRVPTAPADGAAYRYGEADVAFPAELVRTESSAAARLFAPADRDGGHRYGVIVIVIGSGLGGGGARRRARRPRARRARARGRLVPFSHPRRELPRQHEVGQFREARVGPVRRVPGRELRARPDEPGPVAVGAATGPGGPRPRCCRRSVPSRCPARTWTSLRPRSDRQGRKSPLSRTPPGRSSPANWR